MIVKKELDDSLKKAGKFDTSDLDVFAQLFILFDFQGDMMYGVIDMMHDVLFLDMMFDV